MMSGMTISRTGLTGRRTARTGHAHLFTRDRQDGGGGGRDDIDTGDDDDTDDDTDNAEDDTSDDDADDDGKDGKDKKDADKDKPLGEKGERALNAMKEKNRELRRQLREATSKDSDKDADEKVTAARAEEAATWKPLLVKQAATAQLAGAGLLGKPDRLLRLLDLDDIDVDPKSGDIDGLEEQIEDFRKEYPELFRKKGSSRIDATDKDGNRDKDGNKKLSATERQAASLRR